MSSSRSQPPALLAPGAPGSSYVARAPGRSDPLPAVDERLVAPESHAEIVDGRVYQTMGSNQPHGTRHFEATHVFAGALADGYAGAVDMLTRADAESDAAPDVSVFPEAPDPVTGGRQLEEIVVEVLDSERMGHATTKVEKFAARGVRRLFAIRVSARTVYEWDHVHHDWTELPGDAEIVDRCFRVPVPTRALVDRVLADDTVARALLARGNRVLVAALDERREAGLREGHVAGVREGHVAGVREGRITALLAVLAAKGIAVDEASRARIERCDANRLDAWIRRAAVAAALGDVFDDAH